MPLFTYLSSYIIGGWIWLATWGIYQIPLSWLSAALLFRIYITKSIAQSMATPGFFYAGATFAYWLLLFLPIHLMIPQEHQISTVPSAPIIAFFMATTYFLIQLSFYRLINQKYPERLTNKILTIMAIANTIGALLALYSLRFVDTTLDW